MGLTFALASFACVGPFVGTLLAASVAGGGGLRPLLGMVAFATGLALPFFLLALFPSYLKRLPRSGGWLARVKVVMGFVVLAARLKYLSQRGPGAAMGCPHARAFSGGLDRAVRHGGAVSARFPAPGRQSKPDEPMGLGRLLMGMAFLVFALSLAPGMFGGKLGESGRLRSAAASGRSAAQIGPESALAWMKDQYREALDRARREGKLVFVNFTGYACTNCHWMKANMFTRPEIAAALQNFVLVELYTDGTDAVSEANQKLELSKFQHRGDSVLRHSGSGRKRGGDVCGLDQRRRRVPGVFARAGGRNCAGNWGVHEIGRWGAGYFRVRRQGGGGELLGHLVCALH